jgi:hypothetical protein
MAAMCNDKTCLYVSKTFFLNLLFILEIQFPIYIILFSLNNILLWISKE